MTYKGALIAAVLPVVLFMCICGCSRDSAAIKSAKVVIPENPLELEKRVEVTSAPENTPFNVDSLKPDDVIVSVNGYPLTKKAFDDRVMLNAADLMKKRLDRMTIEKILEETRVNYIRTFVGQRLMIDNAIDLKVVTKEEISANLTNKVEQMCKKTGKNLDKLLAPFPVDKKYFFYDLSVAFVEGELIEKKIPPKFVVNDEFVSNVQHQVELENFHMEETNKMLKARLADWRSQIIAKKLDFAKVAEEFSMDSPGGDGNGGIWGDFEEQDIDDPGVAAAVFALPRAGAISEVLEDDNGYHLVKVLSITPPERNESGRIVAKERRKLAHIYFEKQPILIRQTDKEMFKDLQMQMQMRAVNEYVANLQTNSTYKVVYPHGRPVFR